MDLADFVAQVERIGSLSHPERIKVLGWFLHVYRKLERFDISEIRECYAELHFDPPNFARDFARLADRRELLVDHAGYRLEARVRAALDQQFGAMKATIAVSKLLMELPEKIAAVEDRVFLSETLACYRVGAFRATVVMAWNLTFAAMQRWLLHDAERLAKFNARIPVRYPKKQGMVINKVDDFEDLKESEVLEVMSSAGLITGGMKKVLEKELDRRNTAAHPSNVTISQHQAEDSVTDLVHNVLMKL